MEAVFWWVVTGTACTASASKLFRAAKFRFQSGTEETVFSAAAGFGLLAYLVFILGSSGALQKPLVAILLFGLFGFSLKAAGRSFAGLPEKIKAASAELKNWASAPLLILVAVVFFFSFTGALAPPTGKDELCYHLVQPKFYVQTGRIYEVPYSMNSLWPYLMEMLFTLGLLLNGASLAKLFHFSFYILTGAAGFALVQRFADRQTALCAAAIYWLTPAAFIQASFAYVDNALACYVFLACYAWVVYAKTAELRWAFLSGLMAGFAASTKFLGLFILPVIFLLGSAHLFSSSDRRKTLLAMGLFMAAAFAAGGLWYIRSALLRGNPVYPFYPQFFGGKGWFDPTYVDSHGRPRGILSFLFLPWDTAMRPQLFGGENIGAAYLAFLPLAVLMKPKPEFLQRIGWAALGYTTLWYFIDQNIRFYFPALALWAVFAAPAARWAVETQKGAARALAGGLLFALFGLQAVFAPYHFHDEALLFLGRTTPERYLSAREPTYNASKNISRFLKKSDVILSTGEIRGYYFDNPFTLEGDFSLMTRYAEKAISFDEAVDFIKSRLFTHVLASGLENTPDADEKGYRIQKIYRDPALKPRFLKEEIIVNTLGVRYVLYRLIALIGPGPEGTR